MQNTLKFHLNNAADAIFYSDDANYHNISLILLHNELAQASLPRLIDNEDDTEIPEGVCLAPAEAANCMLDTNRTVRFVRGLAEAIKEAQTRNPGKKISILYAGCGPFATLALPVTAMFSPQEIRFTLIDIHQASITNAKFIIKSMDLGDYFDLYVSCNALDFNSFHKDKFDIIITETMTAGLLYEPQAAITTKLSPMLDDNGIFVPEEIAIDAKIKATAVLNDADQISLGDVFILTKDTKPETFTPFLKSNLKIPEGAADNLPYVVTLHTRIKIFGSQILEDGESQITKPFVAGYMFKEPNTANLRIAYPLGGKRKEIRIKAL